MTLYKLFKIVVLPAAAMFALALPATAMADGSVPRSPSSAAALGAWKAAHDTDPHVAITNGPHHQGVSPLHQGYVAPLTVPSDFLIGTNQQGQQTGYWCGPAAVSEAMGLMGPQYSQSSEAWYLKTTTDGTAWSGVNANVPASFQTGYPVRDVINYQYYLYRWNPYYAVVAVPYTPTQTDINNYISHLTYDISNWWPVVGDAWEVAGYPQYHLTGHPDITIFHWFTIIGYQNYGNYTSYEDSATTVWPNTVPAYTYNFSSSTLVVILGGRGYVW